MLIKIKGRELREWMNSRDQESLEMWDFLGEWFNDREYVIGHTSGSTGKPKEMRLNKEDMRASARLTNTFFGIGEGSILLLSLSTSYIAGKMMVVRALEAGADLWVGEVSSHPLRELSEQGERINLAAMVPMQVEETLKVPEERIRLNRVEHLLIGGAPVSPTLESGLQAMTTHCYATYGMTETVSHVALKRLNSDAVYFALGEVTFAQDYRGCLVIRAPHLQSGEFVTNDQVRLMDNRHFEWLGRWDHVINSGGIKFFPEAIERKIASVISCRFFVTSQPDKRLGERIVLVLESDVWKEEQSLKLLRKLRQLLSPYEMPREILYLSHFYETTSGKIIRKMS